MHKHSIERLVPEVTIPTDIWKIDRLYIQLEEIMLLMGQTVDSHDLHSMGSYLEKLSSYHSDAAEMVASAKYYRDISFKSNYDTIYKQIKEDRIDDKFNGMTSPSVLKEYLKSRNAEFNHLCTRVEKMSSGLTHRCDNIRTLIGTAREVYKQTMMGSGQGNKYQK